MDKILTHSVIDDEASPLIDKNSVDPFGDGSGKALWKLDGNGADVSGNYSMTAGTPSWATGLDGQCASLTGSTSQILYRGQELTLQLSNQTLSCWVKVNAVGYSQFVLNNQIGAHARGSTYNEGLGICIDVSGKIYCAYYLKNAETTTDSNGNITTNYVAIMYSSFAVTIGQWYHVVMVMNTNNAKLYIDGVLDCTISSVQNIQWSTNTTYYGRLSIGGLAERASGLYNPLNGLVEQCRLFSRVLTPTEVVALYNEI